VEKESLLATVGTSVAVPASEGAVEGIVLPVKEPRMRDVQELASIAMPDKIMG
jgi:hypothetical protein